MAKRHLTWAAIASAVVAVPMALISMTLVKVEGSWSDFVSHPSFWILFARAVFWYFVAGFLASALASFLMSRKSGRQP